MKKYFSAGLAIFLPILLTLMIVVFIINFLTHPFLETAEALIKQTGIFQGTLYLGKNSPWVTLLSKVLILLLLIAFTLLIGFLGKQFLLDSLFRLGDRFLKQIPYINKIYAASQEVVNSLFSSSSRSFSRVVYVPFPHQGKLSLGFVTCESVKIELNHKIQEFVSVFVPGTPNPTGCLLLVRKEELQVANLKVDEAMRFIVSCGITLPGPL